MPATYKTIWINDGGADRQGSPKAKRDPLERSVATGTGRPSGDILRSLVRDLVTRFVTKQPRNRLILRRSAKTPREQNHSSASSIEHVCDA